MAASYRGIKITAYSLFIIAILVIVFKPFGNEPDKSDQKPNATINSPTRLKTFSPDEFEGLINAIAYPNSTAIREDYPITGSVAADNHLRKLAQKRGYKVRSAPSINNFVSVGHSLNLQPLAANDWIAMKKSAEEDGVKLNLTAAYRSANEEKKLFLERLGKVSPRKIIDGSVDSKIMQILKTTALPGYSRHHTGYTVDIGCPSDPSVVFEKSLCFDWLRASNYVHAKEFGWVPSYPDGVKRQGPDPEPWEYVWVSKEALLE